MLFGLDIRFRAVDKKLEDEKRKFSLNWNRYFINSKTDLFQLKHFLTFEHLFIILDLILNFP